MGFILNDWRCGKCGFEIEYLQERGSKDYLMCPDCGRKLSKVPMFAQPKKEFPDYAQAGAVTALDPDTTDPRDMEVLKKARNKTLRGDEWESTMQGKGYVHTDKSELEAFRRQRANRHKESEADKQRKIDRMARAAFEARSGAI